VAVLFKIPVNVKIALPTRAIAAGLLSPILKPLWRGPKTTGTALDDRAALHKTLFLCKGCEYKMNRRHLRALQYTELLDYHGFGLCDGCQEEQPCAMWMWDGSKHIEHQNERSRWDAVRRREYQANQQKRR
jgi:hypothetical protein